MNNFGMKVRLVRMYQGEDILRNVTEVHYGYAPFRNSVAFESDVHGTGITCAISRVLEIEVTPETEIAEHF